MSRRDHRGVNPRSTRGQIGAPSNRAEHRRVERRRRAFGEDEEGEEAIADNPRPEDWLPRVMVEVCQDILHVLEALDASISFKLSDNP